MGNFSGPQPDIKYCPIYKADVLNVPKHKMKSKGYVKKMAQLQSIHTLMNAQLVLQGLK